MKPICSIYSLDPTINRSFVIDSIPSLIPLDIFSTKANPSIGFCFVKLVTVKVSDFQDPKYLGFY